jgi:RimJ/RimL family protein N-acetyltransferase
MSQCGDRVHGKTLNDAVFAIRRSALNGSATMRSIDAGSLTLEPQTAAHAEAMFVVLNDAAIYEYENEPPAFLERLRERFTKLETRQSPDGAEKWLNWVIRLPNSELIGYVQATVHCDDRAAIAYELSSKYWGRGLAHRAVQAMTTELVEQYRVRRLTAVLKQENGRSLRLLERLGFSRASPELHAKHAVEPGELLMHRECDRGD